jgi:hypothetical protein
MIKKSVNVAEKLHLRLFAQLFDGRDYDEYTGQYESKQCLCSESFTRSKIDWVALPEKDRAD